MLPRGLSLFRPSRRRPSSTCVASRSVVEELEKRTLLSAGDADPTFGAAGQTLLPASAGSINYRVNAVAVQGDGKTLLAGSAGTSNDGNLGQFFLERLNPNGSVDTQFGAGGIITTSFPDIASATAILIQPDGKIVLGGFDETSLRGINGGQSEFALARYNPDGSPDAGFGAGGKALTHIPGTTAIESLALAPGGKILAGGLGTYQDPAHPNDPAYSAPVVIAARYNANGSLDSSFNSTGYAYRQADTSGPNEAGPQGAAIAAGPDGKVLLGSSFKVVPAVWQFNADGSLDTSFGLSGMTWSKFQFTNLSDNYDSGQIAQMLVQPDGKILVAGAYDSGGGVVDTWFVARYDANGDPDSSFGSNTYDGPGVVTLQLSNNLGLRLPPSGLALEANGKIVVAGVEDLGDGGPIEVHQLLANGAVDPTFHTSDILFNSTTDSPSGGAMALAPNGQIVVAANLPSLTTSHIGVLRLEGDTAPVGVPTPTPSPTPAPSAGALNTGFGVDGRTLIDDPGPPSFPDSIQQRVNAVAVQPDGKIVLAGSIGTVQNNGEGQFFLERLNADGSLDTSFGTDGVVETAFGPIAYVTALVIQPDGKIVAGGASEDSASATTDAMFALARYNADGSLDASFGRNGKLTTNFPGNEQIDSLALSSDGRILAAGAYFKSPDVGFDLALYNSDGSLDSGFNGTGWLAYDLGTPQPHAYPTAVAIEADGKILVGAHQGDQAAIYALNSDGSIDKSFGTTGVATTAGAQAVTRLLIQPDGRILAGVVDPTAPQGAVLAAPIFGLVRFGADGSPDSTFGTGGFVNVLGARSGSSSAFTEPPFDSIAALVLQSDGEIAVIANQDQIDSSGNFVIGTKLLVRRLSANGSTDPGFADSVDPAFDPTPYQGGSTAQAAAFTPDGNLVVVANVDSNSTTAAPHWTGIAEYETLAKPAAAVTGPTASGTTGTPPVGASPSPTPLPPGQLAASIIGSLPSTVWTGQNTTLRIRITNTAKTKFVGPASLLLYASMDATYSSADPTLAQLSIPGLVLAGGKSRTLKIRFTCPPSLAAGSYHLLTSIAQTATSTAPTIQISAKAISVASSSADLAASFVSGNSFTAHADHTATIVLAIQNVGSAAATGTVNVKLYASADRTLDVSDDLLIAPLQRPVRLKSGATIRLPVHFKVPSQAFGYLIAAIDPTTTPADSNAADDIAVAALTRLP